MSGTDGVKLAPVRSAGLGDYLTIARFDHATKHVFIVPGMVLAYMLRGIAAPNPVLSIILGLICAVAIASANYTINEFLDREFDKFHPTKSARTAVQVTLDSRLVALQWLVFVVIGLGSAALANMAMFWVAVVFAAQGIVYNVRPMRSKEVPYFDVVSEAINNPLRMMIGWAMIDPHTLPPSSILLAYWTGGGFLMTAKRLSEYREITASHGRELLSRYRASFSGYTETSLTVACMVYAMLSAFFLAVFLIKYRIEYILTFPAFAALFAQYMTLSMQAGSVAQKPEKIFAEKRLIAVSALLVALLALCTFVDMPWLVALSAQSFISLDPRYGF